MGDQLIDSRTDAVAPDPFEFRDLLFPELVGAGSRHFLADRKQMANGGDHPLLKIVLLAGSVAFGLIRRG